MKECKNKNNKQRRMIKYLGHAYLSHLISHCVNLYAWPFSRKFFYVRP